jgi:class 3 adenylate cyclase
MARKERKVVTVLFADLVGFTARAETLDPEDVEAILDPYHARLRTELERHGGTVEKFIGDAVMAIFGALSRARTTPSGRCAPRWRSATRRSRTASRSASPSTPAKRS